METNLIVKEHEVNEQDVIIILLTSTIHAYILENKAKKEYELYITDVSDKEKPKIMNKFKTKEEALQFADSYWSNRKEIINYKKRHTLNELKPATPKQQLMDDSIQTYADATWFLAQRKCEFKLNMKTKKRKNTLKKLMSEE